METNQIVVADIRLINSMQADLSEIKAALQKFEIVPQPKFLTRKEFLKEIKASGWMFDELIRQGLLKTQKIGRKWFVPSSEVQRYFTGEMKLK